MKIILNRCFGGFHPSHKAMMRYFELKGIEVGVYEHKYNQPYIKATDTTREYDIEYFTGPQEETIEYDRERYFWYGDIERTDPILVQVVEELGEEASHPVSIIRVVYIDDDCTDWYIHDYDGMESVEESHRSW